MCDTDILSFLEICGKLKHLKRQGWVIRNIDDCETVAGHTYRMAMMTLLLDDSSNLNRVRCMELALVHDLAESIVGDITPFDNIEPSKKRSLELNAMSEIVSYLPKDLASRISSLFEEYENRETQESKFVKELDCFDLLQQCYEYEVRTGTAMPEFFEGYQQKFSTPFIVDLVNKLMDRRNQYLASSN